MKIVVSTLACLMLFFSVLCHNTQAQTAYAYCVNDYGGLIGGVGPVSFNLSTPGAVTLIQNQTGMPQIVGATWANGIWYALEQGTSNLITIDTVTGNRTTIGNSGMNDMPVGLAYDISTNTLFAISSRGGLFSIDPVTANGTLIGGLNYTNNYKCLACTRDGILYTTGLTDNIIYTVDKTTGEATNLSSIIGGPTPSKDAQEWEYDLENNILYWTAFDIRLFMGSLFSIEPETGEATLIGNFPGVANISGLVIPFTPAPIIMPNLVNPLDKSHCVPVLATFEWTAPNLATNYTIEISENKDFTNIVYTAEGIPATSYTMPSGNPLSPVTNYWWRVKALNNIGESSWWSSKWRFITDGALASPVQNSPAPGETDVAIPAIFSWQGVPAAMTYNLQISTNTDFTGLIVDQTGLTKLSTATGSLSLLTQYFWRVRAENTCPQISPWSEVWYFTTSNQPPVYAYSNGDDSGTYPKGPIAFNPSMPQNMVLLQDQTGQPDITAAMWYNGVWYALDNSYPSSLYTIDPVTGAKTLTGSTGILQPVGITHNYTNNTVYAFSQNGSLYTIDLTTGLTTLIGNNNNLDCTQFVCSEDGVLYTYNRNNQCIYTIDPVTGVATQGMPLTSDSDHYMSIWSWPPYSDWSYDYDNNILYWVFYNTNYNQGELWTVNPETGIATYINPFSNEIKVDGLGVPYTNPLPPIQLVSPENISYCISRTPTFEWNSISDALSYSFQLSDTQNFSNIVVTVDNLTDPTYTISTSDQLLPLTQYWWRVKVQNTNGESSWWSNKFTFYTVGPIPVITLSSPENTITGVSIPTLFSWQPVIGVSDYQLQVSKTSDFSTINIEQTISGKSRYKTMLDTITTYFWRVRGSNICSTGDWSDVWSFETKSKLPWFAYNYEDKNMNVGIGPMYFEKETLKSANLLANQKGMDQFTAGAWVNGVWYNIEGNSNNLVICNPGTGERTLIGPTGITNCIGLTYDLTTGTMFALDQGGQLYNIDPVSGSGSLIGGSTFNQFVALACSKGGNLYAVDGESMQMFSIYKIDGTATIVGSLVADNGSKFETQVASQDWDFDLENDVLYWVAFNSKSWTSQLWRVNTETAVCSYIGDMADNSFVSGLAIPYSPSQIPYPLLLSPDDNLYCIPVTPVLDWYPSEGATSYQLQISTSSDFSVLVLNVEGIITDQYTVPSANALDPLTKYWWRVKAFNSNGLSSWQSTVRKFFTEGPLPPATLLEPESGLDNVYTSQLLKWESVIGAVNYHVQAATNSNFSNIIFDQTGITGTSVMLSDLEIVTSYYWRVSAENSCSIGSWSDKNDRMSKFRIFSTTRVRIFSKRF